MGWDIRPTVEVRLPWLEDLPDQPPWYPIMDAGPLFGRDSEAFGCLFGVPGRSAFSPVAAERGLPPDVSIRVQEEAKKYANSDVAGFCYPSWVTWAELEQVDWDEVEPGSLPVLHRFVRDAGGGWAPDTEVARSSVSTDATSWDMAVDEEMDESVFGSGITWKHGQEWLVGDRLYRAVYPTRRDALNDEVWSLFAIMRELAKRFTSEGVRLVVWFYF